MPLFSFKKKPQGPLTFVAPRGKSASRFTGASGYDAVTSSGKRKPPSARTLSEDFELRGMQRRQMTTGTRNLDRNFTLAAFMVRKHLDFITSFSFQPKTGNDAVDQMLKEFVRWWERPGNFDAAGRHGRQQFMRIAEARAVLDGDVLINRLPDGHLQGVEGDRIQKDGSPFGQLNIDPNQVVNGVHLNAYGGALGYLVHKRRINGGGLEFDRYLPSRFADLHGYFTRFDQCRGISPMAPAINNLVDTYKNLDFALAKAKVSQLFALAIYRKASENLGPILNPQSPAPAATAEGAQKEEEDEESYDINYDAGPFTLDLDDGDEAKILQDATPSDQFQAFMQAIIMISLKALDLPFSFFDEAHTNWVGQQQANSQYMLSASIKRAQLLLKLDNWTAWRIALAVMDGDIVLPRGMGLSDLRWMYVPTGIPPVDPVKTITADLAEIASGMANFEDKAILRGGDFWHNVEVNAEAMKTAAAAGFHLSLAFPPAQAPAPEDNNPDKPAGKDNEQSDN